MDIREFLQIGTSRLNADILVDKIEEDTDIFEIVWQIMLEDTYPLSMRASWVICHFAKKHPYYLEPRLDEIIDILPEIKTESVWRNLLNIISRYPEGICWLSLYLFLQVRRIFMIIGLEWSRCKHAVFYHHPYIEQRWVYHQCSINRQYLIKTIRDPVIFQVKKKN